VARVDALGGEIPKEGRAVAAQLIAAARLDQDDRLIAEGNLTAWARSSGQGRGTVGAWLVRIEALGLAKVLTRQELGGANCTWTIELLLDDAGWSRAH
jgi:hypothetical protein